MEKREHSSTVGGNANWYTHYETVWRFLKKLGIKPPYDPAIPLLGIYPEKTKIKKHTCIPLFSQFSSVAQACPTLCDYMNHSTPGLPVHHQLLESTQTHVPRVGDAIQPSHPLSSPSPPALNLSQHQGLFKWVSFSHQVTKGLEFQLQHQSFQRTPTTDLL